jgi:hypothetical protein
MGIFLTCIYFFSDIDECKDPYLCRGRMQQCIILVGSYKCKCKSATMVGAGGECIDIISTIAKVVAGKYICYLLAFRWSSEIYVALQFKLVDQEHA